MITKIEKPVRGATKHLAGKHNPLKSLKPPKTAKAGLMGHRRVQGK
jgi:hypothetical protein